MRRRSGTSLRCSEVRACLRRRASRRSWRVHRESRFTTRDERRFSKADAAPIRTIRLRIANERRSILSFLTRRLTDDSAAPWLRASSPKAPGAVEIVENPSILLSAIVRIPRASRLQRLSRTRRSSVANGGGGCVASPSAATRTNPARPAAGKSPPGRVALHCHEKGPGYHAGAPWPIVVRRTSKDQAIAARRRPTKASPPSAANRSGGAAGSGTADTFRLSIAPDPAKSKLRL